LAWCIDELVVLLGTFAWLLACLLLGWIEPVRGGSLTLATYLALFGFGWVYRSCFESALAATPGKLLLGIRVVRLDGTRMSFLRAGGRNAARFIPFDALVMVFDGESRSIHDRLAGTIVIPRSEAPEGVLP
jgi:uncharacterized RDD family membrane protein YckC